MSDAMTEICNGILEIMATYHKQENSSYGVDTPGGLEHMGDVWKLFSEWESKLLVEVPPPSPHPQEESVKGEIFYCLNCSFRNPQNSACFRCGQDRVKRIIREKDESIFAAAQRCARIVEDMPDWMKGSQVVSIPVENLGFVSTEYESSLADRGMVLAEPKYALQPSAPLDALSDAMPQEDTVAARSWHKVHGRPDVLGVRTLVTGQREYLMHNEAFSQPYYVEIEEMDK